MVAALVAYLIKVVGNRGSMVRPFVTLRASDEQSFLACGLVEAFELEYGKPIFSKK
jgi:hypothetical protein